MTGAILTNRHVASGSGTLQLSTWDGTDFHAAVSAISSGPDLALLSEAGDPAIIPATEATADPIPGTQVWAAGYPEGDQLTVTSGSVIDYIDGGVLGIDGRVMEITNVIHPGSSGSAVVDEDGRVVGVVFAKRTSNGYGLAVPVSELASFLAVPGTTTRGVCAD